MNEEYAGIASILATRWRFVLFGLPLGRGIRRKDGASLLANLCLFESREGDRLSIPQGPN